MVSSPWRSVGNSDLEDSKPGQQQIGSISKRFTCKRGENGANKIPHELTHRSSIYMEPQNSYDKDTPKWPPIP